MCLLAGVVASMTGCGGAERPRALPATDESPGEVGHQAGGAAGSDPSPDAAGDTDGGPAVEVDAQAADAADQDQAADADDHDQAADDGATPTDKGGAIGPGDAPGALVCPLEIADYDIGRLTPSAGTPDGFNVAWAVERSTTQVPGLGLRLSSLDVGPVFATAGAMHAVSQRIFEFDGAPNSVSMLPVTLGVPDQHVLTIGPATASFIASFGTTASRHGFSIASLEVDATLSADCHSLVGTFSLTIPGTNALLSFGGTTVGAALGAPTSDTDGDGVPDGWVVRLEGQAPSLNLGS